MTPAQRDYYATEIATATAETSVARIAGLMEQYAVGSVVIVDAERAPIGIVTDRDLTCRVIGAGRPPADTTAGDVMSAPLHTARADEALDVVVARMRELGVRRLPVLRDGQLVGLVAIDDLALHIGRELEDLGQAAKREVDEGRQRAQQHARREELEETFAELRSSVEQAGREAIEFVAREFEALRTRIRKPPRSDG